jgi:hypothetical protein
MNEQHEAATVAAMHEQHADSGDYTWYGPRVDGRFISYTELATLRADLERIEALLAGALAEDERKTARIAQLEAERAAVPLEAIAACLRCIGFYAPNALGAYSPRTVAAWLEARGVQDSLLELAAANKRAEAAEATSYDIAAQAALEAQNLREALTAERQRAEAAKAQADAMRADLDILCGLLESVLDGMTVQELAALGDALDAVRERWGLGEVQR